MGIVSMLALLAKLSIINGFSAGADCVLIGFARVGRHGYVWFISWLCCSELYLYYFRILLG